MPSSSCSSNPSSCLLNPRNVVGSRLFSGIRHSLCVAVATAFLSNDYRRSQKYLTRACKPYFFYKKYPFHLGGADVARYFALRYRGGAVSVMEEE